MSMKSTGRPAITSTTTPSAAMMRKRPSDPPYVAIGTRSTSSMVALCGKSTETRARCTHGLSSSLRSMARVSTKSAGVPIKSSMAICSVSASMRRAPLGVTDEIENNDEPSKVSVPATSNSPPPTTTSHCSLRLPISRRTAIRRALSRGSIDAELAASGIPPDWPSISSPTIRIVFRSVLPVEFEVRTGPPRRRSVPSSSRYIASG